MKNPKTVAYVGNFDPPFSTENDVAAAFELLGWRVIKVQENKQLQFNKLRRFNYDLLLITGTWECTPARLTDYLTIFKECVDKKIPTATLHLDVFWGTGRNGRKWWHHPMFHTSVLFTADGDHQEEWARLGKRHIWLPPGVRDTAAHSGKLKEEYTCDVALVGSNGKNYHEDVWPYRTELAKQLREMCQRNSWTYKNPGGDDAKISRGEDLNDFYASAKVTVGDSLCLKKEAAQYWSDRVPEATGRGGFLIMPKIDSLAAQGYALITYDWGDFEGLEKLIGVCLADEEMRKKNAAINQLNTIANHTYSVKVQTILKELNL